ncbi:hypothetical protein NQL31_004577 [Lotmaria passim]
MQASTCCSASSSSSATGAKRATTLWRRLKALQPTLCLTTSKALLPTPSSHLSPMSYSFVVVPPPVPAATSSFESHIASLLKCVPHPVFVTCTSYSPYFRSQAAADRASRAADDSSTDEESATQEALAFLNSKLPPDAGLVLTITGTRATTALVKGENNAKEGSDINSTLTGASKVGVRAVMRDFVRHTELSRTSRSSTHRGGGLMVLRGDDGGYTRHRMSSVQKSNNSDGSAAAVVDVDVADDRANPYTTFADGAALLQYVWREQQAAAAKTAKEEEADSDVAIVDLCLFTGAYAQGHVQDRAWGAAAVAAAAAAAPHSPSTAASSSLQFLEELETTYAETEATLRQAQRGPHHALRPASVETCTQIADALLKRLDAVRQLWQTPSSYSAEMRAACTRWLVEEKVRHGGARVLVTQMLTSAHEFMRFEEDVQRALQDLMNASGASEGKEEEEETPSVVILPGLMAPLRAEQLARAVLQLKVIPGAPLQVAFHTYAEALRAARTQLQSATGQAGSAVETFQTAKEAAEVAFLDAMVAFTVSLARDLHALGYTHVNFSAFQYGCGEAIGRVVKQLPC